MRHLLRSLAALLLAGVMIFAAGCSTTAMKTNPLWDMQYEKGEGPAADRTNLWPLFYYRKPAFSALWPLISATDEGSAFVPFYERIHTVDDEGEDKINFLRLGAVHPFIPAVAAIDKVEDYTRVLNVVVGDDGYAVVPVFFKKDDFLAVVPLLFMGGEEEDRWFWTPVYGQGEDFVSVLGPAFIWRKDRDVTHYDFLAPFGSVWTGEKRSGFRLFPLVRYAKRPDKTQFNLAGLLLDTEKRKDRLEVDYLMPFASFGHRGAEKEKKWNYFFPLWSYKKDKDESHFMSLPLNLHTKKDSKLHNALLNLYFSIEDGDNKYQTVLFPIFHRFEKDGKKGIAALPLFWTSKDKDDVRSFYSPLFSYRSDGSLVNVGGPIFHMTNDKGEKHGAAFWPLIHWWKTKDSSGSAVAPLYAYGSGEEGDGFFLSPLGGYGHDGDTTFLSLLGPLYFSIGDKDKHYRTVAFPIFHHISSEEESTVALLPAFIYRREGERKAFYSLPLSIGSGPRGAFVNVALLLANWKKNDTAVEFNAAVGFIGYKRSRTSKEMSFHLTPLFKFKRTNRRASFDMILDVFKYDIARKDVDGIKEEIVEEWAIGEIEAREANEKAVAEGKKKKKPPAYRSIRNLSEVKALLGFFNNESFLRATAKPDNPEEPLKHGEVVVEEAGLPPMRFAFQHQKKSHFFPVYNYEATEGKGSWFSFLWRVFDSKSVVNEDGTVYRRQRVLWRLFHRETEGDETSIDAFPFIAYDKTKDLTRFSFAAGLFSVGKKEGRLQLRLFWIPVIG